MFGYIKQMQGFRRLPLWGLDKAGIDVGFEYAVYNLMKWSGGKRPHGQGRAGGGDGVRPRPRPADLTLDGSRGDRHPAEECRSTLSTLLAPSLVLQRILPGHNQGHFPIRSIRQVLHHPACRSSRTFIAKISTAPWVGSAMFDTSIGRP